ncbi:hypothetical protein [Nocardia crassostreae]|uniref:hypothetical protein n=1 Tax=Nocardia crassostreae TaxID=53428 RepID=UPI0008347E53|nr:hypothetical protein [Nocardia crassostreae]
MSGASRSDSMGGGGRATGGRTTESDPQLPREEADYTGSWSDWIPEPKPEPVDDYDDFDDYDEDDYYEEPAPRRRAAAHRRIGHRRVDEGSRQQWAVPLLGLLAVFAIVAAVAVQIAKMSPDTEPRPISTLAAPASTTSAVAAAEPSAECPNEVNGAHVRGNGPGGTGSGPDVILALQSRYYGDRSGEAVREMYAPDANAPAVATIQAGIDSIPVGTTYCVQILPGPFDGKHVMIVSETHPDKTKRTWPAQLVITTVVGDRTLIASIVPLKEESTPR